MGSKRTASLAFFLSLNILFFALVSACGTPPATPNPKPNPSLKPTPTPYTGKCPKDALKLGVCANVLNLVKVQLGSPPTLPCCSLIQGLVDLEAAVCLCTAIKANVLGLNLDIPLALSLVLNNCGKKLPTDFECT